MKAIALGTLALLLLGGAILQHEGLLDGVLAAARNKARDVASVASGGPGFGRWSIRDFEDPITREKKFEARMEVSADSNGRHGMFQVTANCNQAGVAFQIVYHADFDKELGYKMESATGLLSEP